jgi:hypothetical protein
MAIPGIETTSTDFDNNVTKSMPISITEFKRENLGKVMSVIGILKNKKLERNTPPFTYGVPKPLFENFEGGEWVLVPLKQGRKERLCAGIFASFLCDDVDSCYIITEKRISSEDHTTEFSFLVTSLTNLYLFKKHFAFDQKGDPRRYKSLNPDQFEDSEEDRVFMKKESYRDDQHEDPKEYRVPLEKNICAEFEEWLEDYTEKHLIRRKTITHQQRQPALPPTKRSPLSAPLLPERAAQNKDEGYETIYEKTDSEKTPALIPSVHLFQESIIKEKTSSYSPLKKNPLFNNYSPRPTHKNSVI